MLHAIPTNSMEKRVRRHCEREHSKIEHCAKQRDEGRANVTSAAAAQLSAITAATAAMTTATHRSSISIILET